MRDTKDGKKKTGIDALLEWCQTTCAGYPEVKITNFTTSWKDGLAFCALMHKYHSDSIDFKEMINKTPHERLVTAFEVGALHVRLGAVVVFGHSLCFQGIPSLLDPEDVWDIPVPEKLSMITYLGVVYKGLCR